MSLTKRWQNNSNYFQFSVARINNPSIFAASFDGRDTHQQSLSRKDLTTKREFTSAGSEHTDFSR